MSPRLLTAALMPLAFVLAGALTLDSKAQNQQPVRTVNVGDYEPVVPWPQPLPDTDLSHAFDRGKAEGFAAAKLPASATVFELGPYLLVDATKLSSQAPTSRPDH